MNEQFKSGQYVIYEGGIVRFMKYSKSGKMAVIESYSAIFKHTFWHKCKPEKLAPLSESMMRNLINRLHVDLEETRRVEP